MNIPKVVTAMVASIAMLATVVVVSSSTATSVTACGLANAAFCDTFTSVYAGGRQADLDPTRWEVGRVAGEVGAPSDLQPFPPTPVSACRTGVTTATVDHDVLVCNVSGRTGQIETALSAQNYGLLSMRPRQPFDFAGRTGTISYDVDAVTTGILGSWTSLFVTDDVTPVASNAAEVLGYLPTNGIGISFNGFCSNTATGINVYTYRNTVESNISPSSPTCFATKRGSLNHIQIRLSQTSVAVWASDAGGANFRQIFSAAISLSFSRGYVHFQAAERAPAKYAITPGYSNNYWSNLAFDGPVLAASAASPAPASLTADGSRGTNVGYPLLAPLTLTIPNVPAGLVTASLSFAIQYQYATNPTLHYSINGGPLHIPSPAPNIAATLVCSGCPGPNGGSGVAYHFPVNVAELHIGSNTVTFTASGFTGSWPYAVSNVDLLTDTSTAVPPSTTVPPATTPSAPGCGLTAAAFCATFDAPHNGGTRTGDLDPVLWGVSRIGQYNDGNGQTNFIPAPSINSCGSTGTVAPPADVRICGGKLFEAVNDGHQVANLDMYPKQPFDFAGRTGKIVFDVSADSEGPHGAWPEVVITDKPVPGIRSDISNQGGTTGINDVPPPAALNEIGIAWDRGCLAQPNTTGVGEIYVARKGSFQQLVFTQTNCVIKGSLTKLNHFEIRISQNHVEVWGTDAGSTTLKQLAVADNINLSFTRGLVWINDVHYNADKFPSPLGQREHTFAWDNLGFDGPKTYRDLGFDVPDAKVAFSTPASGAGTNEGYFVGNGQISLNITGVRHDVTPTAAQVVFNYFVSTQSVPSISVNGNAFINTADPFTDTANYLWRTISVPIPLAQAHDGTNTIVFKSADGHADVANISLILVAGAVVP